MESLRVDRKSNQTRKSILRFWVRSISWNNRERSLGALRVPAAAGHEGRGRGISSRGGLLGGPAWPPKQRTAKHGAGWTRRPLGQKAAPAPLTNRWSDHTGSQARAGRPGRAAVRPVRKSPPVPRLPPTRPAVVGFDPHRGVYRKTAAVLPPCHRGKCP